MPRVQAARSAGFVVPPTGLVARAAGLPGQGTGLAVQLAVTEPDTAGGTPEAPAAVAPDPPVPGVEMPNIGGAAPAPGGTPAVAAMAGGAGGEPDELIKRIFDPLLRRLKAELRADRDRLGMVTDVHY